MGIPTWTSAANEFLNFVLNFCFVEPPQALSPQVHWKRKIVCILNVYSIYKLNIVYVMRIYCKYIMCLFLILNKMYYLPPSLLPCLL